MKEAIKNTGIKLDHVLIDAMPLDIDVDTSLARVGKNKDRIEIEAQDFHEKVRNGFLDLARKNPERIHVIDATQDIDKVYEDIIAVLEGAI